MSKLRIESKAQIMRDKSIQRDKGAYKKAKDEFALCAFRMVLQGRLYCENSKGEIVKIEVKS